MHRSVGVKFELSFLSPPPCGIYRCKVVYDNVQIISVEYQPYVKKEIKKLKLIESDIEYPKKYLDRSEITKLLKSIDDADDIIIVKNGLIADTSIANVALLKNGAWITPKKPLLNGTMREKLLMEGLLKEADISAKNLAEFDAIAIMNALRGFEPLGNILDTINS
jgi:4-amino-4-deoxychorismate lyase